MDAHSIIGADTNISHRYGVKMANEKHGLSFPVLTRFGYPIDLAMLGHEIEMSTEKRIRWQAWKANTLHPHCPPGLEQVWCSSGYLVQVAQAMLEPWVRLTIRRIDGREVMASWSELQAIKNDVVGEHRLCVEVYPSEQQVVNLAQMRHLFVAPDGFDLPCVWKKETVKP